MKMCYSNHLPIVELLCSSTKWNSFESTCVEFKGLLIPYWFFFHGINISQMTTLVNIHDFIFTNLLES